MLRTLIDLAREQMTRADTLEKTLVLQGRALGQALADREIGNVQEAEFRVFSQWGEDGILHYLTGHVPVPNRLFVEFGVEDYRESNTRFLLASGGWRGVILDGGTAHQRFVRKAGLDWKFGLRAVSAFVTRENINELLTAAGAHGDIGLLSIDIDGNDYWIWDAIDCIAPRIVVVEYNSLFGPDRAVTIPYDPAFRRSTAHRSNVYYGASLAAVSAVARRKGYTLVGCNSAGANAFFVRDDCVGSLPTPTVEQAFVARHFREARDASGRLLLQSGHDEVRLIEHLEVVDVATQKVMRIRDLFAGTPNRLP
jgi:hypothetical protein